MLVRFLERVLALLPWRAFGPPVVPVVVLSGIVASGGVGRQALSLAAVAGLLERAFAMRGARAVALLVNSPGGAPVQAALIHRRILALAKEKGLPVFAFAEDVAASGGYMIALAADEIFADAASIVGSIGVISAGFGFQGLLERVGIERRVHATGPAKHRLDPFVPEREEDVARLAEVHRQVHEGFKALVRARRGERLTGKEETLFSGDFWVGEEALALGLIDGLGHVREVMRERFGAKVQLKIISRPRWPFALPPLGGSLGRTLGPAAFAEDLLEGLAARALWARFGL